MEHRHPEEFMDEQSVDRRREGRYGVRVNLWMDEARISRDKRTTKLEE